MAFSQLVYAQQKITQGKVTDTQILPFPGVSDVVKGKTAIKR
ncbi:hypothetical protein [Maribellus comscasis]|nr:hypothetical protein [Maribellus comscasis]